MDSDEDVIERLHDAMGLLRAGAKLFYRIWDDLVKTEESGDPDAYEGASDEILTGLAEWDKDGKLVLTDTGRHLATLGKQLIDLEKETP